MRAYERLLQYARVYTTSDPESGTHPSAAREFDLAHMLVEEMKNLGIEDARVDVAVLVHKGVLNADGLHLLHQQVGEVEFPCGRRMGAGLGVRGGVYFGIFQQSLVSTHK